MKGWTRKPAKCECGKKLKIPRPVKVTTCRKCAYKRLRKQNNEIVKAYTEEVRGRVCLCGATDSESTWGRGAFCSACARRAVRNGVCECGRPMHSRMKAPYCKECGE